MPKLTEAEITSALEYAKKRTDTVGTIPIIRYVAIDALTELLALRKVAEAAKHFSFHLHDYYTNLDENARWPDPQFESLDQALAEWEKL